MAYQMAATVLILNDLQGHSQVACRFNCNPSKIYAVFTARRYASAVLAVIVCLSVCLSVTSRSCTKMAKPRIRLTTPYDSPETLVFQCQKSWRNSHDITPNGGAKQKWGRFLAALCSQYLAISQKRCKIQGHSYYGKLIGTHVRSIEWCYFQ